MALSDTILNQTIKDILPIEQVSIQLLIETFDIIKDKNQYDLDWEEEQFSAHIVSYMNEQNLTKVYSLHIDTENKLLDENKLPVGENNPKILPRIDISISSWSFDDTKKLRYFFEAKNLCENNWQKKSGARVKSDYYLTRYITTGIENFRIEKYYNGAIIGYVLEGNTEEIINKLNNKLLENPYLIQNIQNLPFLDTYNDIYHSKHKQSNDRNIEIKHIFLKF